MVEVGLVVEGVVAAVGEGDEGGGGGNRKIKRWVKAILCNSVCITKYLLW